MPSPRLKRLLKRTLGLTLWLWLKDLLYRPHGVLMGRHAWIFRPFAISPRHALTLGPRAEILPHARIWSPQDHPARIEIGEETYIGRHLYLTAIDRITIGPRSVLADHVFLTDFEHGYSPTAGHILHQPLSSKGPITIGEGCFIGYRAAILPGVTLGDHCVVGANAVVIRSFPAYSMLAGNPAQLIKRYSADEKRWVSTDLA
jgi:acetyltransferase-like isoleucine patch superfamily enzyme